MGPILHESTNWKSLHENGFTIDRARHIIIDNDFSSPTRQHVTIAWWFSDHFIVCQWCRQQNISSFDEYFAPHFHIKSSDYYDHPRSSPVSIFCTCQFVRRTDWHGRSQKTCYVDVDPGVSSLSSPHTAEGAADVSSNYWHIALNRSNEYWLWLKMRTKNQKYQRLVAMQLLLSQMSKHVSAVEVLLWCGTWQQHLRGKEGGRIWSHFLIILYFNMKYKLWI